jgi:hypothetical protein
LWRTVGIYGGIFLAVGTTQKKIEDLYNPFRKEIGGINDS